MPNDHYAPSREPKRCVWCGGPTIGKRRWTRKNGNKRSAGGLNTCSVECWRINQDYSYMRRFYCLECGKHKGKETLAMCCSDECKKVWQDRVRKWKPQANVCLFTPRSTDDYDHMIEILQRKGYGQAQDIKEKWTYTTDGYSRIEWIDIVARDVELSGKASSS